MDPQSTPNPQPPRRGGVRATPTASHLPKGCRRVLGCQCSAGPSVPPTVPTPQQLPSRCPSTSPGLLPQPHNRFSRSRVGFWAAWTRHKVNDSLGLSYSRTSSRAPDQDSGDRDRAGPRGCLAHSSPSPATPAPQGMQNFPPSEDHRKSPKSPFCLPRAHSQHPMTAGMHPATA